jgi:hypothetical protein
MRDFPSTNRPDRHWVPPSLLFGGYRVLSLRVQRPRCDAGYSPPSNAEVKNEWNYTSPPLTCLYSVLFLRDEKLVLLVIVYLTTLAQMVGLSVSYELKVMSKEAAGLI